MDISKWMQHFDNIDIAEEDINPTLASDLIEISEDPQFIRRYVTNGLFAVISINDGFPMVY